jgi:hypothetical protein
MAILNILNSLEMDSQGIVTRAKQGAATDAFATPFSITVSGTKHEMIGSLATATVVTVYDDDNDSPVDWDYLHYWADQDSYIQFVGASTNATFKVAAKQPFVLPGFDSILAAADTTIITGGAEPSVTDIDSIVIGNYSGVTMNYHLVLID